MARLPYPEPETLPQQCQEILDALPDLNIFHMLAHAETALAPSLELGGTILSRLELDPVSRELVILLVAKLSEADYEWVQHVGIAEAIGIPGESVAAIERADFDSPALDERSRALLRFTEQATTYPRVSNETFANLRALFSPREIVETLMVIGYYLMLARVMTVLDIELDEAIGSRVIREAEHRQQP